MGRGRPVPTPPASCSSPGVQGPSLVGGGSTGSQVSPVRTPHGLELLPGSVEWTWARGAGSGQPGLPKPLSSSRDTVARRGLQDAGSWSPRCEVRIPPHLLTTKASSLFVSCVPHAWTNAWHTVVTSVRVCKVTSVVSDSLQIHGLCSAPVSSVPGILQARILQWVALPSYRGSS